MKRIAQLRKERGLSQIAFALRLNISQYMVSAYESGRNQPSIELLIQIADFFDVSADYLLERTPVRTTIKTNGGDDENILLNNYNELNKQQKQIVLDIAECLRYYKK